MSGLGSALLATFIIDAIVSLVALWWAPATAYQQRPRSHRLRPHTERAREDFLLDVATLAAVWALLVLGRH